MDLNKIILIKDVFSTEDTNKYLSCGWVLLAVVTESSPNTFEAAAMTKFIIGWSSESGEIKEPDLYSDFA